MIILRGHPFKWEVPAATAVTVGVFDGVHIGHRRVLSDLVESARLEGLLPAVVTFDPHPLQFLGPERAPQMLTSIEQRVEQFRVLGIEVAGVLYFPDIRELLAAEFAEDVLAGELRARTVVVGADFRFGRDRRGDATLLEKVGKESGFEVRVVDMFGHLDGVVSSTRIRALLNEGAVEAAAALLARPYELTGNVIRGDGRGRTIGVPTANLDVGDSTLVPANGVYATRITVGAEQYQAVVNIGTRPTFAEKERRVEAHLLDFDGDLYGQHLAISFTGRLRSEQKFESIDALKAQIDDDIARARTILAEDIRAG